MSDEPEIDARPVVGIVGMAGRFPGADSVEALWALLQEGREGVAPVAGLSLGAASVVDKLRGTPGYVGVAGCLRDIDRFDAGFFGFNPRQAADLDPQQRLFLECTWHALEDAGIDPERFDGTIGVFAGAGPARYAIERIGANAKNQRVLELVRQTLSVDKDFLATRVSYKLNLRGPSVSVQTACSTSLVAVHMACQSLMSGECDIALAGGVNIPVPHGLGYLYSDGGILSPDGRCRAFDRDARGTVPGAGAGVVVLRRMEDAQSARHRIYAGIRNSAINNDGNAKVGFTAPSVAGQSEVLAMALSGTDPCSIGMIEAHGTGTSLGDAVELTALAEVFQGAGMAAHRCALGSIKTNIGHLDAAAGIAGLIKAALCLDRKQLVPSLHFEQPHELLAAAEVPFYVNVRSRDWERGATPRRAGVSSFGMGGTNAHVVLEEAEPALTDDVAEAVPLLFPLSAKSPRALQDLAHRLSAHLAGDPRLSLPSLAYTLQVGRTHFEERALLIASSRPDLVLQLERLGQADAVNAPARRVAFHFDAALGVRATSGPLAGLDDAAWRRDFEDLMLGLGRVGDAAIWAPLLEQVCNARRLIRSGVVPDFAIASGVGLFAAACVAGAFTPADCGRLIMLASEGNSTRGEAMNSLLLTRTLGPLAFPLHIGRVGSVLSIELASSADYWLRCIAEEPSESAEGRDAGQPSTDAVLLPCSSDALAQWLASCGSTSAAGEDASSLQRVLAALWLRGVANDWHLAADAAQATLARLPGYPFERSSHWLAETDVSGPPVHYLPCWKPLPWTQGVSSDGPGRWLLVAEPDHFADQVAARAASLGVDCVRVAPGAGPESAGAGQIDWDDTWRGLAIAGKSVSRLLYVLPAVEVDADAGTTALAQRQEGAFFAVLEAARAAARCQPDGPVVICIATRRFTADLQQQLDPFVESVASLPALLQQAPGVLQARVVDLGPSPTEALELEQQAHSFVAEAAQADGPALTAYRRGRRSTLSFDAIEASWCDSEARSVLRLGGVYLITGGLGMIGLALAQALAASHGATLLLVTRDGLPALAEGVSVAGHALGDPAAARRRAVEEIERSGGRVGLVVADVADAPALRAAVVAAEKTYGPINGIFHLAAALDDSSMGVPLDQLRPEHLARQLRAKAGGVFALEQVFAGASLDFAVLFSSTAALLGGTGLAAYAAANAVVDGLARSGRTCAGTPWMALGWDGWATDGAALQGALSLTLQEGIDALMRALAWKGVAQVVVSKQPFAARLPSVQDRPSMQAAGASATPSAAGRPTIDATPPPAGANQLETMITRIWEEHIGCSDIGADDDFFKLGGDSLSMLGVTQSVAELLHVDVPLREFLRSGLTVRGFSQAVLEQLAARSRAESAAAQPDAVR